MQAGALNRLFDEKAFSWTLAMEDLETVLPGGVQVTTLEPVRAKDGHITLHLRVIGPRDLAVDLVRNLEHSKRFLLPRIVGENAETSGGPGEKLEPVSASNRFDFDLLAEYNPATFGDRTMPEKPAAASGNPVKAPAPAAGALRCRPAPAAAPTVRPPYLGRLSPCRRAANRPLHIWSRTGEPCPIRRPIHAPPGGPQ